MKQIRIEMWDIDKVIPYELNAKVHDKKQVDKIAKSITEFGWDQPIVVDAAGSIIKGHGRRLAAISLGLKQVPVLVRDDLSEDQVKAARLADNRVAVGDIDMELLQKELAAISIDLNGIFDAKELTFLEADLGEMDESAFTLDLDGEVAAQAAETATKVVETDGKPVKIEKALGFKSVQVKDERLIARFMAQIEAESGLEPAAAFVDFISKLLTPVAA